MRPGSSYVWAASLYADMYRGVNFVPGVGVAVPALHAIASGVRDTYFCVAGLWVHRKRDRDRGDSLRLMPRVGAPGVSPRVVAEAAPCVEAGSVSEDQAPMQASGVGRQGSDSIVVLRSRRQCSDGEVCERLINSGVCEQIVVDPDAAAGVPYLDFVSNDRPTVVVRNGPGEIDGAFCWRRSRSTQVRRERLYWRLLTHTDANHQHHHCSWPAGCSSTSCRARGLRRCRSYDDQCPAPRRLTRQRPSCPAGTHVRVETSRISIS